MQEHDFTRNILNFLKIMEFHHLLIILLGASISLKKCECMMESHGNAPPMTDNNDKKDLQGCFKDDPGEPMFSALVTVNDLTPNRCIEKCLKSGFKFAAIAGGETCFCSDNEIATTENDDNCNSQCSNGENYGCGGQDGFISVYKIPMERLQLLTMEITDSAPTPIFKYIQMKFDNVEKEFVCSIVDHGDGAPAPSAPFHLTDWHNDFIHFYHEPMDAEFELSCFDEKIDAETSKELTAIAEIVLPLKLEELYCPERGLETELITCNLTLLYGQDLTLTVNFEDERQEILLPDTSVLLLGNPVPQYIPEEDNIEINDVQNFYLSRNPVTEHGFVAGFEAIGTKNLYLDFEIFKPECKNSEKSYCPENGRCATVCPPYCEGNLDSDTGACDSNTDDDEDIEFKIIYTLQVDFQDATGNYISMKGYKYKMMLLDELVEVFPGYVLGFIVNKGAVIGKEVDEGEGDIKYSSPPQTTNIIHYVSATMVVPVSISVSHVFETAGIKEISVEYTSAKTDNFLNNKTSIKIKRAVKVLTIEPESLYAATGTTVNYVTKLQSGTDVDVIWNFEDGTVYSKNFQEATEEEIIQNFIYYEAGIYTLNVTAIGEYNEISNSCIIYIQYPVDETDWELTSESPILISPSENISIELKFSGKRFPTNITRSIDWGDESSEVVSMETDDGDIEQNNGADAADAEPQTFELIHPYTAEGNYTIVVNLSNEVSFQEITLKVEIYIRIKNANIEMKEISLSSSSLEETISLGITDFLEDLSGDENNELIIDSWAAFKVSWEEGSVNKLSVELVNGTSDEDMEIDSLNEATIIGLDYIVMNFTESGVYFLNFIVENPVQSVPVLTKLIVIPGIEEFSIVDFQSVTNITKEKKLEVNGTLKNPRVCLEIFYDDPMQSENETYGNINVCNSVFPNAIYRDELEYPLRLKHIYNGTGNYTIEMRLCCNPRFCSNNSIFFQVDFLLCEPIPQATIMISSAKNTATSPSSAVLREKSKPFKVVTTLALERCISEANVIRHWNISRVTNKEPLKLQHFNIDDLDQAQSTLYVPELYLDFGIYRIDYSAEVIMTVPRNRTTTKRYFTNTSMYIEIRKSALIPIMVRGSMSALTRSFGWKEHLNPGALTIDPDDPEKKMGNISVEWFCYRWKKNLQFSYKNPDKSTIIKVPTSPVDVEKDEGGCFGTGDGFLNIKKGDWLVDTQYFYSSFTPQYDNKNLFLIIAIIKKDERKSVVNITLLLTKEKVPVMRIRCKDTEHCFPTKDGILVNNNTRLALIAECLSNCPETMLKYKWKIKSIEGKPQTLSNFEDCVTGINFYELSIHASFFERYNTIGNFLFEVNITSNETSPSICSMRMDLNNHPYSPHPPGCSLKEQSDPPKMQTLASKFLLTCNDWTDPENHRITKFVFYGIKEASSGNSNSSSDWHYTFCSGEIPRCETILPCGDIELFVMVEDEYGSSTNMSFGKFYLKLPPDYKKYTDHSWMEAEEANGDESRQKQIFYALMALKECTEENFTLEDSHRINDFLQKAIDTKIRCVDDIIDLLRDIASYLTEGKEVDRAAKGKILEIIKKIQNQVNERFDEINYEKIIEITENTIRILGAVAKSNTMPTLQASILPSDREEAETMEYDSDVDPNEIVEVNSYDQLEEIAIVRSHKKESQKLITEYAPFIYNLEDAMLRKMVVNEPVVAINTPVANALFIKVSAQSRNNGSVEPVKLIFDVGKGKVHLPDICTILSQIESDCDPNQPFAVATIVWDAILQTHGKNLYRLAKNTATIDVNLFTGENSTNLQMINIKNSSVPFNIYIPLTDDEVENEIENDSNKTNKFAVIPKTKWFEYMGYHQFFVENTGSSISVQFTSENDSIFYAFFIKHEKKPQLSSYDYFFNPYSENHNSSGSLNFIASNEKISKHEGVFYLGVVQLKDEEIASKVTTGDLLKKNMINSNFTSPYTVKITNLGCFYYNEYEMDWMNDGCSVGDMTSDLVHCRSNHLTTFGGGLVVQPNTIDFTYVFANASFTDNLTIYITIIITLVIFIVFLIWARRKDRKDIEKLGALPLPDNDPKHKYYYEILIFTGSAKESSTDSKISFQLSGDRCETGNRTFGINHGRKTFRRDGIDVFVMAVPGPLGQLQFCHIWHDNSGVGHYASWYLNYIIFRDIQTGEKFEFIANSWLAVERYDGEIERMLPVARKEDLLQFNHLFNTTTRKNLTDGHLWFSVFLRPPRSRFTRCQRVCSCMALLYLSMLVNAMWYGTVPEKPPSGDMKMGPFNLSLEQISVGFFSNLIVFPPSFLLIYLFRKSRPRQLRPSRITEAIKMQRVETTASCSKPTKGKQLKNTERIYQRKKRFTLPWWCSIIAWILCIACICISVFFLWAYGIQFGNEKTKKWITALIISFISSVFITQPIKVFLLAILFSSICKKIETDEDDADEDERDPELNHDEEWLEELHDPTFPKKVAYSSTLNPSDVERTRTTRKNEVKMWKILQEIAGYLIFLWILSVIGFSVRDPNAFLLRQNLVKTFVGRGIHDNEFLNIKTVDNFKIWFEEVLIPNIDVKTFYNKKPALAMAKYLKDGVNRLLGSVIIRQIRGLKEDCNYNETFWKTKFCSKTSQERSVDTKDYGPKWNKNVQKALDKISDNKLYRPFRYSSADLYKTTSLWGRMDIYSGNGYLYELDMNTAMEDVNYLIKNNWIDSYTKAIFIEFSTYNAQVDMFAVVRLVLESRPAGAFEPFFRINPIRLSITAENMGNFVFLCKTLFIILILFLTVRELYRMFKQGRDYFKQFWNVLEIILLFFSHSAIAMYIVKAVTLRKILQDAKEGQYIKPVDLPLAQQADEIYSYCISMVIFLGIIRCNKILRFLTRISILAESIWNCVKGLGGFFILFFIIMIAYTFLFTLLFRGLDDCRSFLWSWNTLVSLSLNRGEFHAFYQYHHILGPIAFFSFAFLFNLILLNVFLSIVLDTFDKVKTDITERTPSQTISNYILERFKVMFGFRRHRPIIASKPVLSPEANVDDKENKNSADELPEKVNRLLDYINDMYFDGKLQLSRKEMMKLYPGTQKDYPVVFNSN